MIQIHVQYGLKLFTFGLKFYQAVGYLFSFFSNNYDDGFKIKENKNVNWFENFKPRNKILI